MQSSEHSSLSHSPSEAAPTIIGKHYYSHIVNSKVRVVSNKLGLLAKYKASFCILHGKMESVIYFGRRSVRVQ